MASNYTPFPAKIVTPQGILFDGLVRELEVSSTAGGLGILARRAPIVAELELGRVSAELEDGTRRTWATEVGFAQASNSTATVVVQEAVEVEAITEERANELIEHGKQLLTEAGDNEGERSVAEREIAWGTHLLQMRQQR